MYLVILFTGLYKVWKVWYLKNKKGVLFAVRARLGHTGLDWDLNPMTGILVQEWTGRFGDTKDSHVTTKRETGVIQLQARHAKHCKQPLDLRKVQEKILS